MSNITKYLILPLVLFIAALAVVFFLLWPLWNNINAALLLKEQTAGILLERQKLTANLGNLIRQHNSRVNDVSLLNKVIPAGQETPELLTMLEAIASENGLKFMSVDFKPKDKSAVAGVKILSVEIKVKGSYPAFVNYLKSLETNLRLFDVVSVSFNGIAVGQAGARADDLDFNLSLNTYYQ